MSARMLPKVKLAFVPEQVNIPITLCMEGIFAKYGIEVDLCSTPEGTGAMLDKLESGEADVALTVTDAFMVGKAKGRKIDLVGTFVDSPLTWAIAGNPQSSIKDISDLTGTNPCRFGISRPGSGSHTMAYYASLLHGIDSTTMSFTAANNFEGLRQGLKEGTFDSFLWETFTTKPWFDSGALHKIGEVETPWTAFSIVMNLARQREGVLRESNELSRPLLTPDDIRNRLFPALAEGVCLFRGDSPMEGDMPGDLAVRHICQTFGHAPIDARAWFDKCRYAVPANYFKNSRMRPSRLFAVNVARAQHSVEVLKKAGLIDEEFVADTLWKDEATGVNNDFISLA